MCSGLSYCSIKSGLDIKHGLATIYTKINWVRDMQYRCHFLSTPCLYENKNDFLLFHLFAAAVLQGLCSCVENLAFVHCFNAHFHSALIFANRCKYKFLRCDFCTHYSLTISFKIVFSSKLYFLSCKSIMYASPKELDPC